MKKTNGLSQRYSSLAGATSFMIGLSSGFAFLLTMKQVPNTVAEALLSVSDNKIVILLIINVFLLIIGCFIDNISSCTILAPILLPVVVALGVDPIHFGIIMTMNLAIGFITPPYGANLFIASAVGNNADGKHHKASMASDIDDNGSTDIDNIYTGTVDAVSLN